MKNKIFKILSTVGLSFIFIIAVKSIDRIEITPNDRELIANYRLNAVQTWGKEFLMLFEDANSKKLHEIDLNLHHLSGNANHILGMYNSTSYQDWFGEAVKYRYSSIATQFHENFYSGRSREVFNRILSLLKKFNQSQDKLSLWGEISDLERDTYAYKRDRHLWYSADQYPYEFNNNNDYGFREAYDYDDFD